MLLKKSKKIQQKPHAEVEEDIKKVQDETELYGFRWGFANMAHAKSIISGQRKIIFLLTVALMLSTTGYHFMLPLKKVEYMTIGYEINDNKVSTVKVMPATELSKNVDMMKLVVKYFLEETVQLALSNFKDARLLKQYLSIVQTRTSKEVFKQFLQIHKNLQDEITQREVIIETSTPDGYGGWILGFKTKDTSKTGEEVITSFKAKITYELYGFNNVAEMNIPIELLKKNPNPIGLKIVGFHRIREEEKKENE